MLTHLDRDSLLALAEGTIADDPHLHTCASCRDEVAVLRGVMARVAAADEVPEPSPLFWDHFSARVSAAIDADVPVAAPWWRGWRAWTYATAACAATLLAVVALPPRISTPASGHVPTLIETSPEPVADLLLAPDEEWEWVVGAAVTEAETDEAFDASLVPATADIAVQDLDGAERSALASLLRAELAGRATTAEM